MDAAPASRAYPGVRVNWRVTPVRLAISLGILALAVRVIGIGMRPLWLDEAYSAWFSARDWHYLWFVVPTYEPHPPFYCSILKMWRALFGGGAVALRSLSVLLGVAAVPVVIACAIEQERQDPTGRLNLRAAAAGFLAAFSPMLILLDQEARPYPLLIFAYAVAILGIFRLMGEFRSSSHGTWKSWLLLGTGTELTLWSHDLGLLYAACIALALLPAWLARPFRRERFVRGGLIATAVAVFYLPCLLMLLNRAGDWGNGWLIWKPMMLFQLIGLYTVPGEALTAGSIIAAVAILLLMKRALQFAFESHGWNCDRALLLLWLGPVVLAVAISATLIPIFLLRTLGATLIPACLALAAAIARTSSSRERTVISVTIAITLVPAAVQIAMRAPMERWDEVSAFLQRNVAPADEVWLYPNDSALPLGEAGFQLDRMHGKPADYPAVGFKGPIRAGSPAVVSLTRKQAEELAASTRWNVPIVWLVTRQSSLFDPDDDVPNALSRVRRAGPTEHWRYIAVQPYYAAFTPKN